MEGKRRGDSGHAVTLKGETTEPRDLVEGRRDKDNRQELIDHRAGMYEADYRYVRGTRTTLNRHQDPEESRYN